MTSLRWNATPCFNELITTSISKCTKCQTPPCHPNRQQGERALHLSAACPGGPWCKLYFTLAFLFLIFIANRKLFLIRCCWRGVICGFWQSVTSPKFEKAAVGKLFFTGVQDKFWHWGRQSLLYIEEKTELGKGSSGTKQRVTRPYWSLREEVNLV